MIVLLVLEACMMALVWLVVYKLVLLVEVAYRQAWLGAGACMGGGLALEACKLA